MIGAEPPAFVFNEVDGLQFEKGGFTFENGDESNDIYPVPFDDYNLISALHSFMTKENKKYKNVLPPLSLLPENQNKELMSKLRELEFFPEKNIAA